MSDSSSPAKTTRTRSGKAADPKVPTDKADGPSTPPNLKPERKTSDKSDVSSTPPNRAALMEGRVIAKTPENASRAAVSSLPPSLLKKLEEYRAQMLTNLEDSDAGDTGTYLGLQTLPTTYKWIQYGSGHTLVDEHALKQTPADREDEAPSDPESAVFSIIARISYNRSYVAPDGGYGSNRSMFTKEFSKTQLNIQLEPIQEHPVLSDDFKNALEHLKAILAECTTSPTIPKSGVLVDSPEVPGSRVLRLRHVVFKKRSYANEEEEEGLPAEFHIKNWPVNSTDAQEALERIIKSHVARPLLAYDEDGQLLPPSAYDRLRGSICAIRFSLLHYAVRGEETMKDVYVADIASISMIQSYRAPTTPVKRIAQTDPFSPSKRLRAM
ncbi:hypothetical protein FKP32DRAFT_1671314 [Trametes sanguinea]|nr:hypothetical protein FKP32DRAFT_1671314 [Trametes sanguinea]